jgi:hypothetical protein
MHNISDFSPRSVERVSYTHSTVEEILSSNKLPVRKQKYFSLGDFFNALVDGSVPKSSGFFNAVTGAQSTAAKENQKRKSAIGLKDL